MPVDHKCAALLWVITLLCSVKKFLSKKSINYLITLIRGQVIGPLPPATSISFSRGTPKYSQAS